MTVTNPAGQLAGYAVSLAAAEGEPALDTGLTDEDYLAGDSDYVGATDAMRKHHPAQPAAAAGDTTPENPADPADRVLALLKWFENTEQAGCRVMPDDIYDEFTDEVERVAREVRAAASPEVLPAAEAAQLPPGSWVVRCDADGVPLARDGAPYAPMPVGHLSEHARGGGWTFRVLHRAPEEPLRVGMEVRDRRTLDRLPVGTVLRVGWSFTIAVRSVNGWSQDREPLDPDRLIGYTVVHGAGRVIDLPKGSEA